MLKKSAPQYNSSLSSTKHSTELHSQVKENRIAAMIFKQL